MCGIICNHQETEASLSAQKYMKKEMRYVYTMEYYLAVKRVISCPWRQHGRAEGSPKVQTSSDKTHKSWGCGTPRGDHS